MIAKEQTSQRAIGRWQPRGYLATNNVLDAYYAPDHGVAIRTRLGWFAGNGVVGTLAEVGADPTLCAPWFGPAETAEQAIEKYEKALADRDRKRREAFDRPDPSGPWVTLGNLRKGAIFETQKGVRAVKSEYRYPNGGCECVLLASGEYAHFGEPGENHNDVLVREIKISEDP